MTLLHLGAAALLGLSCAACHGEQTSKKIDNLLAEQEAVETAPKPAGAAFRIEEKNDLLDFTYGWSTEAAAVPELAARFEKAMRAWKTELLAGANEDKAFKDKQGYPFNGYMGSTLWTTAGQSPRLLSLVAAIESYTGGAHGSHGTKGLLWDRSAKRAQAVADLFTKPASRESLLKDRWCSLLNEQRSKRRGEPLGTEGLFDDCPKLDDISIVPIDKDGDGRFEQLTLIADPYVAGPWAEGDYEVGLPVTDPLLTALKPEYRDSFEAQPQ